MLDNDRYKFSFFLITKNYVGLEHFGYLLWGDFLFTNLCLLSMYHSFPNLSYLKSLRFTWSSLIKWPYWVVYKH